MTVDSDDIEVAMTQYKKSDLDTPQHPLRIVSFVPMNTPLNYRYWKRIDFNDSERCKGLFRDKYFAIPLEHYWLGSWHNAADLAWRVWQDPDYVEIDETEALSLMPILLELHQKKAEQDARQVRENLRVQQVSLESAQSEEPMPLSSLLTAAITMHELFLNFKAAGFTEDQSLKLVGEIVKKPMECNEQL